MTTRYDFILLFVPFDSDRLLQIVNSFSFRYVGFGDAHLNSPPRSPSLPPAPLSFEHSFMSPSSSRTDSQDLDLLYEPLSSINQRLLSPSSNNRSASFTLAPSSIGSVQKKLEPMDFHLRHPSNVSDGRSRHNGPLAATTNQIYQVPRTFVHQSDARAFPLTNAVQMKPLDDVLLSHNRCRPCHRQNALRYKSVDQDNSSTDGQTLIRYPSMERRSTSSRKSASFDIHDELRPAEISWSVKEKAKIFEHHQPRETRQFSTGRENYV